MGPHRPALSQAQQAQSRQWGHKGKIKLYINIENLKDTSISKDKLANPKRRSIRTPIRSNHITKYIQRKTKAQTVTKQAPHHAPAKANHVKNHRHPKHYSHSANTSATIHPYPQMRFNPGQHLKTIPSAGIPNNARKSSNNTVKPSHKHNSTPTRR